MFFKTNMRQVRTLFRKGMQIEKNWNKYVNSIENRLTIPKLTFEEHFEQGCEPFSRKSITK